MPRRSKLAKSSSDRAPTIRSADGPVSYRLFGTETGVVVQRSARLNNTDQIDHFIHFAAIASLAAFAELEARSMHERWLEDRLVRRCLALFERRRASAHDDLADQDYCTRVMNIVQLVRGAVGEAEVVELMHQAARAIGADGCIFASWNLEPNGRRRERFLLDCDAVAFHKGTATGDWLSSPWIAYALARVDPIFINPASSDETGWAKCLRPGIEFEYALLIPMPGLAGTTQFGGMCLGSATEGLFDKGQSGHSWLLAKTLATEVSEWWVRTM